MGVNSTHIDGIMFVASGKSKIIVDRGPGEKRRRKTEEKGVQ